MAFRDQLIRCGACGSEFVYTVREQRKRAEMGLPTDPPVFCADCRGADVRLAEAASIAPPESRGDIPRGDIPRDDILRDDARGNGSQGEYRPAPPRPQQRQAERIHSGDRGPRPQGRGDRDRRGGPPGDRGRGGRREEGGRGPQRERQTDLRIRHVGTVKWFNTRKGYGFIAQEEGGEVFVHLSGVLDEKIRELEVGTPVEFEIEHTARGPQAVDVIPLA